MLSARLVSMFLNKQKNDARQNRYLHEAKGSETEALSNHNAAIQSGNDSSNLKTDKEPADPSSGLNKLLQTCSTGLMQIQGMSQSCACEILAGFMSLEQAGPPALSTSQCITCTHAESQKFWFAMICKLFAPCRSGHSTGRSV